MHAAAIKTAFTGTWDDSGRRGGAGAATAITALARITALAAIHDDTACKDDDSFSIHSFIQVPGWLSRCDLFIIK